jgi:hypothetical protein
MFARQQVGFTYNKEEVMDPVIAASLNVQTLPRETPATRVESVSNERPTLPHEMRQLSFEQRLEALEVVVFGHPRPR